MAVDPSEEMSLSQIHDDLNDAIENKVKLTIDPESIYNTDTVDEKKWKKNVVLKNIFYSSKMLCEIMQYFRRTYDKKISLTDAQITEIIKEIKEKYKEQEVVIFDKKEDIPAETPVDATPPKTPQKKKKVVVDTEITPQE